MAQDCRHVGGFTAGISFGIVAEEVRNLASKETAERNAEAIARIQEGAHASQPVADRLLGIIGQIREVEKLASQVAEDPVNQSQGIVQISQATQAMDDVMQSNAANASQSSDAAHAMNLQAEALNAEVAELRALV